MAGQRHNGYEFTHNFYSGKEEGTREVGVEFVAVKNMKRNILEFKAVDERICVLRIKTRFQNISIIKVHAPTEETEQLKRNSSIRK